MNIQPTCGEYEGKPYMRGTELMYGTFVHTENPTVPCPASHPSRIEGTNCCGQIDLRAQPLYQPMSRRRAAKRVPAMNSTQLSQTERQNFDGPDGGAGTNFGKNRKTRSFQSFRKAYKKKHPGVSDHTILVKYLAGLVRLRSMY